VSLVFRRRPRPVRLNPPHLLRRHRHRPSLQIAGPVRCHCFPGAVFRSSCPCRTGEHACNPTSATIRMLTSMGISSFLCYGPAGHYKLSSLALMGSTQHENSFRIGGKEVCSGWEVGCWRRGGSSSVESQFLQAFNREEAQGSLDAKKLPFPSYL